MSKDKKTTTTNVATADPTTLAREQQMWDAASGLANQPYQAFSGQRVAGFTPDQQAGFDATRGAAGAGAGAIGSGIGLAGQAGAYNPMMVQPGQAGPAAQADLGGINALYAQYRSGGGPSASARDVSAMDGAAKMGQYLDPYTGQVVDAALSDLDIQRQRAIMQGQAQATAGGAFGGSRHGVMDSLTNAEAMRAAGSLSGQLRSQGFQTALGAGMADANRDLQAQMSNQGADVATSTANAQNALSMLGQQAGLNANVGMFNAGALNNMSQFNTNLDANAQIANQGAGLTANAQRLGAAGTLGSLGQAQQQNALTGANALTAIGGMQQGLNQANLDVNFANWLDKQNDPYRKLAFQQGFRGTPGQTNTQTNVEQGSTLGGIAGAVGTIAGGPLGGVIGNAAGSLFGGGGLANSVLGGMQPQVTGSPGNFAMPMRGLWDPNNGYGG